MTKTNPKEEFSLFIYTEKEPERWLFNERYRYTIPLYQREYAWTEKEIQRLIDDINNPYDECYYRLGSLSVLKSDNSSNEEFEVIDGQQRLTTLYMLLTAMHSVDKSLTPPGDNALTFKDRQQSNDTLKNLTTQFKKELNEYQGETTHPDNGITAGYTFLYNWARKLKDKETDWKKFKERLEHTIIYRIPIPEHTNIYKFFIRMNTRGKQLELTDVLKARLMQPLSSCVSDLNDFDVVWSACSNMNRYLRKSLDNKQQEHLWQKFVVYNSNYSNSTTNEENSSVVKKKDFVNLASITHDIFTNLNSNKESHNIVSIKHAEYVDDFESFLNFPTFLMHVLKLCALNKLDELNELDELDEEKNTEILSTLTDDKKLLEFFEVNWKKIFDVDLGYNPDSSLKFLRTLATAKHLYDGWVLKRRSDIWSIKHLSDDKSYEINSFRSNNTKNDTEDVNEDSSSLHNCILLIQECLRVTYTSSLSMHWVTDLLHILYQNKKAPDKAGNAVLNRLEGIAIKEVKENINNKNKGTHTPRILFNFLDYLLWRDGLISENDNNKKRQKQFKFAYWNSVEHWYPQNPDDHKQYWPDKTLTVDIFGNLFLLKSDTNSSLSNKRPFEKLERLKEKLNDGLIVSLKAIDMMNTTQEVKKYKPQEGSNTTYTWQDACQALGQKHVEMLQNAKLWTEKHQKEINNKSSAQKAD